MNKIVMIPIKGMIRSETPSVLSSTVSREVIDRIEKLKGNRRVKAIIFEINSSGGTPFPCKEIADTIKNANKPTIAWIREYATSGAYWIASSCDEIVADPLSTVGGIGVTSLRPDFSELMKRFGIDIETMTSGIYKGLGLPYKKATPEERKLLKRELEMIHKSFVEEVTKNRKLDEEKIKEVSSGKVYLGVEAKELGLIDHLGGKEKAIEVAKKISGIKEAKVIYVKEKKPKDILSLIREIWGWY